MHGTLFPIAGWMIAIFLVGGNRRITSTRLAAWLGVQRRTGWTLRERIYKLMEKEDWAVTLCDLDLAGLQKTRCSSVKQESLF